MKNKLIAIAGITLLPLSLAFAETSNATVMSPSTPATQVPVTGDSPQERAGTVPSVNQNSNSNVPSTDQNTNSNQLDQTPVKKPTDFNTNKSGKRVNDHNNSPRHKIKDTPNDTNTNNNIKMRTTSEPVNTSGS